MKGGGGWGEYGLELSHCMKGHVIDLDRSPVGGYIVAPQFHHFVREAACHHFV